MLRLDYNVVIELEYGDWMLFGVLRINTGCNFHIKVNCVISLNSIVKQRDYLLPINSDETAIAPLHQIQWL